MSDIKLQLENLVKGLEEDTPPLPPEPKVTDIQTTQSIESLIEELGPAINATPDPEETNARIYNAVNLSDFLNINESYAYRQQPGILKEYTGEKTPAKNFFQYWKNMAEYHQLRTDQSKIASKMMWEQDPEKREEYWDQIMEIDSQMPSTDTTVKFFPVKWIGNLIPLLGQHWEGIKRPQTLELAAAWSIAQGTAAFAVGQIPPLTAAPEEILTVPTAMASGLGFGLAAGMSAYIGELEATSEYIDLIKMGIEHKPARAISMGVGVGNLLIETVQIGEWLKTVPGAKGVLSKGIRAVTRKLTSEKWLKILKSPFGRITKAGIKNAIFAGKETAEEVAQEGVQIFGQELAIWLHNRAKQGDEIASKLHEAFPRLWQVAKQSFGPFFLMGVPTHTVGAFVEPRVAKEVSAEKKTDSEADILREIEEISALGHERMMNATSTMRGLRPAEIDWLEEDERERLHELKLKLPRVSAEEVKQRVEAKHNLRREVTEKPVKPQTLVDELTDTFSEKVKQYAKAFRDRAMAEYREFKEEGIVGRIKRLGKIHIRDIRGTEEAADIPKGLRPQVFTKNEAAMDMDEMADALGVSEEELKQSLINYKEEKPSAKVEDYYEEAKREMPTEEAPETTFKLTEEQEANIKAGKPVTQWAEEKRMTEEKPGIHGERGLPRPILIGEADLRNFKKGQIVTFNNKRYELLDAIKGRKEFYRTEFKLRDLETNKKKTISGYHEESEVSIEQEDIDKISKKSYTVKEGESNYYEISERRGEDIHREGRRGVSKPGGVLQPSEKQIFQSPLKLTYKRKGYFRFPKTKISSPADVAFAFRELKNSAVERMYIVGLKKDRPVSIEPISVGLIDRSLATPYETLDLLLSKKADGFYLVHNHPSRNVTASVEDINVTRAYAEAYSVHGIKLAGHVIIDDVNFGLVDPSYHTFRIMLPEGIQGKQKVARYNKYIEWLNKYIPSPIKDPEQVVEIMKGIEGDFDNNTLIFYLDPGNIILTSEIVPNKQVTVKEISTVATKNRAPRVLLGNSNLSDNELKNLQEELLKYPIYLLDDIVITEEITDGFRSKRSEGVIKEKGAEYGPEEETTVQFAQKYQASPAGFELAQAYEDLKDAWIGEKDVRKLKIENEGRRLKRKLKEDLGYQRATKYVRDIAVAIQLAIDTQRNPGHVAKYWNKLTDEQKRIVRLSQDLPFEALFTLDKIQESYRQIGIEAADVEVIYNIMDNYTNRVWDLKGEEIASIRRRFGIKSRHRKARVFDTIIEGWAHGYELKVMDAIENLMIYKKEIVNTILDKQFLNALLKVRDVDGKPLLTTNSKLAKELEYTGVKHPNFKKWAWRATTDVDIITKNLKRIYTETKKVEKAKAEGKEIEAKPIDKLEKIIEESLEIRGYTEGEARNAIESVKKAPTKEIMYETIETIERNVVEREEITGYKFTPVYGRRSLLTEAGALLEESDLYAPKKVAKNLNNILGTSVFMREEAGVVKDIAEIITKYNAIFKAWILQSTLFHHQAYLRSYYLPGLGELKFGDLSSIKAINEGIKMVEDETPEIMLLVRNGLTLGRQQEWQEQLIKETTVIDKWVEKIGATKKIRDKLIALRERHTAFLFGTFGAGLKAKRAIIELRDQMRRFPEEDVNVLAKRAANLINDDFGGLHLQRLGRNPTLQHIMRIFLLAPDWTESNVRSMVKAFKAGSKEERAMYQRFWAGVILKGAATTSLCNFALAGGDVEEMMKRYEIAWRAGPEKLKWMAVDITPIYKFFGADIEQRKYWYLIGHFRDPFKFVTWPLRSLKHKGSVAFSLIIDAITGTDWAGRRFSTWGELLKEGELVKWGKQNKVIWAWFPSYVLSEVIGTQPVQLQNLIGWLIGEMHGFDAILNSLGMGVSTIYEEQLKEVRKEMRSK